MPVARCQAKGRPGYRWGRVGRCYHGKGARASAERQAAAIRAAGYVGNISIVGNQRRPNPLRIDPTRSITLRRAFAAKLTKQFRTLKGRILRLVVDEDAFGLANRSVVQKLNAASGLPPVRQDNDYQCGAAALLSILRWHGREDDLDSLSEKLGVTEEGTDAGAMIEHVEGLGLQVEYGNKSLEWLADHVPALASVTMWGGSHWVAVESAGDQVRFMDPGEGEVRELPAAEFDRLWEDDADRYAIAVGPAVTDNAFCPTGEGGGIDPTCSPGGSAVAKLSDAYERAKDLSYEDIDRTIAEVTEGKSKEQLQTLVTSFGISGKYPSKAKLVEQIIRKIKQRKSSAERVKTIGNEELVLQAFCPTGEGGGLDNTCPPSTGGGSLMDRAQEAVKGITDKVGGSVSAYLDKLPGGKALREKMAQLKQGLEARYGKRTALAIVGTANAISWGAFVAGPMVGYPNYIPASGLMAVGAVLAEGYVQGGKLVDRMVGRSMTDNAALPFIKRAALQLVADLHRSLGQPLPPEIKRQWELDALRPLTNAGQFAFESNPDKVRAFQRWLKGQMADLTKATEEERWKRYIEEGFKKGAGRSYDDTLAKHPEWKTESLDFYKGTKSEFLRSSFAQPESVEKVKLLAGRAFDELEDVTREMSNKMSRVLTDGLVQGKHPLEVARDLNKQVDIGESRAKLIARTEFTRVHAEGQLNALEALGVTEVGVMVEWATAGDDHVCEVCEPLEGIVLKIDEAHNMLPRHPNCRCAFLPANLGEDGEDQLRSKGEIGAAIRASQRAGGDDEDEEGWGPATAISKDRPESMVDNDEAEYWFHRNEQEDAILKFARLTEGATDGRT